MMILIVGATGRLGGLIARRLLERAEKVRALGRPGSDLSWLTAAGGEVVVGDLKDRDSLLAACDGVDTVITTANSLARGGDDTIESVDRDGNINLIEAASAQGVRRFIFVSALGASLDSPVPLLRAKAEAEQRLRSSGMAWTILEPNGYMDVLLMAAVGGAALAGEPVTLVGEGRRMHSLVAIEDVASYALAALGHPEAENQTLYIGGPQPFSWRDAVTAFERGLGRSITVHTVRPGDPVPGLPDVFAGVLAALDSYDSPMDMTETAATYGIRSTSLDDFVGAMAGQAG
jgi:NADH dehydrogenase